MSDVKALIGYGVPRNTRDMFQCLLNSRPQQIGRNSGFFKKARHEAAFLFEQSQGEMFHVHGLMVVARGNGLRLHQGSLGFFGKFREVHKLSKR